MTPEQALKVLDASLADDRYEHNRRAHVQIVEAVKVLHELIHPKPKGKKVAKRKPTKR